MLIEQLLGQDMRRIRRQDLAQEVIGLAVKDMKIRDTIQLFPERLSFMSELGCCLGIVCGIFREYLHEELTK